MGCQPPDAGAGFDEREFRGTAEMLPHFRELPGQEPSKDGMDIDARVVVGNARGFALAVVAVDGMVETFAHEVRERQRAVPADAVGKQFGERGHAPLAPAASGAGWAWCV